MFAKLKNLRKDKKRSIIFSVVILLYSLFSTIYVSSVLISFNETIGSIAIPNGYLKINLTTPYPEYEVSIGLTNKGIYEFTDFSVNISMNLSYLDLSNNQSIYENLFRKYETLNTVLPLTTFNHTIRVNYSSFNITVLEDFWNNYSNATRIQFLMDIIILGRYYYRLIPVKLSMKNLNAFCPNC